MVRNLECTFARYIFVTHPRCLLVSLYMSMVRHLTINMAYRPTSICLFFLSYMTHCYMCSCVDNVCFTERYLLRRSTILSLYTIFIRAVNCFHFAKHFLFSIVASRDPSAPEDKDIVILEEAFNTFGTGQVSSIKSL